MRHITRSNVLLGLLILAHVANDWLMLPRYTETAGPLGVWGSQLVLLTFWAVLGPLPFPVYLPRLLLWCALASALALRGLARQNHHTDADDVVVAAYMSAFVVVASLAIFGVCRIAFQWRVAPATSGADASRLDGRQQVGLRAIFFDTALAACVLAVVLQLNIDSWTLRQNSGFRFDLAEMSWFLFLCLMFTSATFGVARFLLARAANRATWLWAVAMILMLPVPPFTMWLLTRPSTHWPEMTFVLAAYGSFIVSLLCVRLAGYRIFARGAAQPRLPSEHPASAQLP